MVKRSLGVVLFAFLCAFSCAAADNPFVGDWKLNASKSTLTDKMVVEHVGGSKYAFNFGGGPETIVVDGTDQPSAFYGGDSLSVAAVGDTWKITRKGKGRTLISASWSLSADGNTLTDHFTGFKPDGSPTILIYTYKRTGAGSGFAGTWVSINEEAVNFDLALQIRPFEENGLAIIDPSQQILGNMNFAAPLVRKLDERTLELMRKKAGSEPSPILRLKLSSDLKALVITVRSAPADAPHILAFDRAG